MQPRGMKGKLEMQLIVRRPELKELVREASRALACLDADRLEELALSCQALNRDLAPANARERKALAAQARDASRDMAVFGRVLEATRANLQVMSRLRNLRLGRVEYGEAQTEQWGQKETTHGNN
jgi:hypothetical protein